MATHKMLLMVVVTAKTIVLLAVCKVLALTKAIALHERFFLFSSCHRFSSCTVFFGAWRRRFYGFFLVHFVVAFETMENDRLIGIRDIENVFTCVWITWIKCACLMTKILTVRLANLRSMIDVTSDNNELQIAQNNQIYFHLNRFLYRVVSHFVISIRR